MTQQDQEELLLRRFEEEAASLEQPSQVKVRRPPMQADIWTRIFCAVFIGGWIALNIIDGTDVWGVAIQFKAEFLSTVEFMAISAFGVLIKGEIDMMRSRAF